MEAKKRLLESALRRLVGTRVNARGGDRAANREASAGEGVARKDLLQAASNTRPGSIKVTEERGRRQQYTGRPAKRI